MTDLVVILSSLKNDLKEPSFSQLFSLKISQYVPENNRSYSKDIVLEQLLFNPDIGANCKRIKLQASCWCKHFAHHQSLQVAQPSYRWFHAVQHQRL